MIERKYEYFSRIEALLFVAGEEGIRIRQLAELLSLPPTGIQQSLEKLAQKYEKDQDSSLDLIETGGAYRLVTKPQFAAILKEYSKAPINQSLSRAALEPCPSLPTSNPSHGSRLMLFGGLIQVER